MKEISRNETDIDKKCGPEDVRTQKNIIFVKILKVAGLIPGLQTHSMKHYRLFDAVQIISISGHKDQRTFFDYIKPSADESPTG